MMEELTKSHSTLTIVLGNEVYGKNLVISCLGPLHICGPTQWEDSRIALRPTLLDSGKEGIVVIDEGSGVRIVAESIEVRENVNL
jgi:hypothetical protein